MMVDFWANFALVPKQFQLDQNFPNPFNSTTTIRLSLLEPSIIQLSVYNVSGQLIESLVKDRKDSGEYFVFWDAANLSSGVYFYQLCINGKIAETKKAILIK
jgi:hypothetical protein